MSATYATRDDAILHEIINPLREQLGTGTTEDDVRAQYDVTAIALTTITATGSTYRVGVDPETFWQNVAFWAR